LASQRLGFRGTEDLGGGLKAMFQIESTLTAGGAGSNGFGSRPTFVGLEGAFGTVVLGRQDTPLSKATTSQLAGGANNVAGQIIWSNFGAALTSAQATTFENQTDINAASTAIGAAGLGRFVRDTTIDRAINYISPNFNGFSAEVQVGQTDGEVSGTGLTTVTAKTDDRGFNVRYTAGPLTVHAANHTQKTTSTTVLKNVNNYAGATYDLGVAKVSLQHATTKSNNTAETAEVYNNKGTQFGVQVPVSATLAAFATVGTGTRTFDATDKLKQTSLQVGGLYSLSKRTRLYTIYGQQELKGDNTATTGVTWKESQFAVGVNHTF
jgi:predicted porin